MMKKRYGWIVGVAALVLCAGAVWLDGRTSGYELTGVSDAVQAGEEIYIIDNNGDAYDLFRIDGTGTVTGHMDLPKLDGTWWNAYSSLSADADGQVYVYSYGKSMISNERRSLAYRLDFDNSRLEEFCVLPPDQMSRIQVIYGAVYYTASEGGETTGFFRKEPGQEGECLLLLERPYEEVKTFFYQPGQGLLWLDWNRGFYLDHVKIPSGRKGGNDYVNLCAGISGIVFTDMEQGLVVEAGWDGQDWKALYSTDDMVFMNPELEYQDILPLHYGTDGSMSAGIETAGGRRILGLFDGEGKQTAQFGTIRKSGFLRMMSVIRYLCAGMTLLLALGLVAKAGLWWTKGTIPIVVQLLGVLVPVVISSSLWLQDEVEQSLETRIMKMDYDLLYHMADGRLSIMDPADLTDIDLQNVPEDKTYRKIFRSEDFSELVKTIHSPQNGGSEPIVANTYQWVFLLGGGELRYVEVDGLHYYGTRVAYDRSRQEMEKMEQAIEKQHIVKTAYNDFTGDFVALYVPVIDGQGRSVGIMESGLNRRILTYEIRQQMNRIHGLLMLLAGGLAGILLVVLGCFLYPLARVKAAVEEVSQGNLGKVIRVWGRDEVAGIAAAFNHMSLRLKEQVEFIRKCSDGYAVFVPEKVFEILEREDITQVELGDQKAIPAAVLQIGSRQFQGQARTMTGEELYGMMNRMLEEMIPVVTGRQGVVDHMAVDGLTAYYPEGSRQALLSAVAVCQKMNWRKSQGEEIPVYRAAIHYGPIRVGIVGHQARMEASTISEVLTLAGFLQELAEDYGARILIMESALEGIEDFRERFHGRMIGYLYIRMTEKLEAVYEVYDGEEEEQWQLKEETRELFQHALSDYLSERYYDARLKFARVLRRNPRDLAARAYVYRCDEYYQAEEKRDLKVWLEEY